jgi:hypothetical protein
MRLINWLISAWKAKVSLFGASAMVDMIAQRNEQYKQNHARTSFVAALSERRAFEEANNLRIVRNIVGIVDPRRFGNEFTF